MVIIDNNWVLECQGKVPFLLFKSNFPFYFNYCSTHFKLFIYCKFLFRLLPRSADREEDSVNAKKDGMMERWNDGKMELKKDG